MKSFCKPTLHNHLVKSGFPPSKIIPLKTSQKYGIPSDEILDFLLSRGIFISVTYNSIIKTKKAQSYLYQVYSLLLNRNLTEGSLYPITETYAKALNVSYYLAISHFNSIKNIIPFCDSEKIYSKPVSHKIAQLIRKAGINLDREDVDYLYKQNGELVKAGNKDVGLLAPSYFELIKKLDKDFNLCVSLKLPGDILSPSNYQDGFKWMITSRNNKKNKPTEIAHTIKRMKLSCAIEEGVEEALNHIITNNLNKRVLLQNIL